MTSETHHHTSDYLQRLGVPELPALTSPFDPGYDPLTVEGHLQQSHHLMSILKISMACWIIADESATRRKVRAARKAGIIPTNKPADKTAAKAKR